MSESSRHQQLIEALGAGLTPVRPLAPPWRRALGWLAVVAIAAIALLLHFGAGPMLYRWRAAPDEVIATAGAVVTAITGALAALMLAVPGRSRRWAWLPLPSALVWIVASGFGCLRAYIPGVPVQLHANDDCLIFIVSFSIPLSALLIWLLRRACPLHPVLAAVLVGLASASASAALLEICHNFNASASDLLMHAVAVALVIGANALSGGRLLGRA